MHATNSHAVIGGIHSYISSEWKHSVTMLNSEKKIILGHLTVNVTNSYYCSIAFISFKTFLKHLIQSTVVLCQLVCIYIYIYIGYINLLLIL